MRLYLAHPLDSHKVIRERELLFEEVTGIDLVNPFYDIHRAPGAKDIVQRDVETIKDCDGLVAVLTRDQMIGTTMDRLRTSDGEAGLHRGPGGRGHAPLDKFPCHRHRGIIPPISGCARVYELQETRR